MAVDEEGDVPGHLASAGVSKDAMLAANMRHSFEVGLIENAHAERMGETTLQDAQDGLWLAILQDMQSAWLAVFREAVSEVVGVDPDGDAVVWAD